MIYERTLVYFPLSEVRICELPKALWLGKGREQDPSRVFSPGFVTDSSAEYMIAVVLLVTLLISFAATVLLVPVVRRVAMKKGWVDKPDRERKLHDGVTPNIGGIAIAAGFGIGLLSLFGFNQILPIDFALPQLAILGGALVMVLAGFYDDVHGLGFKQKFLIQIIVAYLLLHAGIRFDVSHLPFIDATPYTQALYSIPLTLCWIVGIINAVNLLDGLDGLASGVSIIAFASLAFIFGIQGDIGFIAIAVLMIGALAGFLLYNYNPASIFMGDSGSLFLGYMLAVFSLTGTTHSNPVLALLVPMIVLGLPILDTTLCIVRRLLAGRSPFAPDHDHIHHRLVRLWSQRKAVLIMYGAALWFGIAAVLMARIDPVYGFVVGGGTLFAVLLGISVLGYLDIERLKLNEDKAFPIDMENGLWESWIDASVVQDGNTLVKYSPLLHQSEWVVNGTPGSITWHPSKPTVSVIVPVYNGGDAFTQCLDALKNASPPPDEIIIVAEGETDGMWRQALGSEGLVLKYETAQGPAYARNIGAEAASGDILFFVDADVIIPADTIGRIKECFLNDPELSGVIGSYDDEPSDKGFLSQYRNLMHHHVHQMADEQVATFWGACGAVRQEDFFAVGGFSDAYKRPCIEDIEFGYRLWQDGKRVHVCKEIQVKHLKRWTVRSMLKTDFFDRALPWTQLLYRYRRVENNLNLQTSGRLSVVAAFTLVGALIAALWYPSALLLAAGMGGLLISLNAPFYQFLLRKRGPVFALTAMPWHWFYFLYGGIAFVIGTLQNLHYLLEKEPALVAPRPSTVLAPEITLQGTFDWQDEIDEITLLGVQSDQTLTYSHVGDEGLAEVQES